MNTERASEIAALLVTYRQTYPEADPDPETEKANISEATGISLKELDEFHKLTGIG